jgi:hypothetical protein
VKIGTLAGSVSIKKRNPKPVHSSKKHIGALGFAKRIVVYTVSGGYYSTFSPLLSLV